jgi:peptidylprolyl isomerase
MEKTMANWQKLGPDWRHDWRLTSGLWLSCIVLVGLSWLGGMLPAQALPQGNAIKDPQALLRYALPIASPEIRTVQEELENIANELRANRRWGAAASDAKRAALMLTTKSDKLLAAVPADRQAQAQTLIDQIQAGIVAIQDTIANKSKPKTLDLRTQILNQVGDLEALMVKGFPFEVPAEYRNLPQLKGRATVAMKTTKGDLTIVLDGFSAPVTAGNFADLVKRGFYNGLPFTRAEESYVVQAGDPPGDDVGFIDPKTKKYRAIPLEILIKGDAAPVYGETFEELGRYLAQPVLPFSSYGAVALARPNDDANGGSSQFFFFLFEPELTVAGANLLDGRYAIFGFVTEGQDILRLLKAGDKIESAQIVSGLENLVEPAGA